MRSTLLCGLLAVLLLAGCASTPAPAADPEAAATPPATTTETAEVRFSQPAAGPMQGVFRREPFEVPEGVLNMTGEAEWSCVSLCRLDVRLVSPSGKVAFEDSRGSGVTMEIESPAPGTWNFDWGAGEGASVAVDGTLHLTYERRA